MEHNPRPRTAWSAIRAQFPVQTNALPRSRSADEFWAEFHQRRRTTAATNESMATDPVREFRYWPILAAASFLLFFSGALLMGISTVRTAPGMIRSFHVGVPYRAVMVLDAPGAKAAILWVEGMEIPPGTGEQQ